MSGKSRSRGVNLEDTEDASAKSDTLTVEHTKVSESGNRYRAVFTNGVGSPAVSNAASLTVEETPEAPKVKEQPTNQEVTEGETATFKATASGKPAPTVKWEVSTNHGATFAEDTTDAGRTTDTLSVEHTTAGESGDEYRAVFSNGVGSPATSSAATLTVKAHPG